MILEIHPTAVELFLLCQTAYMYAYLMKLKSPPGIAAVGGSGVHFGHEKNMKAMISEGSLLPREAVLDYTRDGVVNKWEKDGVHLWGDEIKRGQKKMQAETIDRAVRLGGLYYDEVAPSLKPKHSERKWKLEVPGYDFSLAGTMDLQEVPTGGPGRIIDLKTRAVTPPQSKADRSIQLTIYAMAASVLDGQGIPPLRMDNVVDLKTGPKMALHETTRTQKQFEAALRTIQWMSRVVESGDFGHCQPDHWKCHPKWCGYTDRCQYYGGQE